MIARFGDVRGGHIDVYARTWRGCLSTMLIYDAYYYSGTDGILLGVVGIGDSPEDAARNLWQKLHR